MRRYRSLLRLLPRPFRERFGSDMQELFAIRHREASFAGRGWVWTRALVDLIAMAVRERSRPERLPDRGKSTMGTLTQDLRHAVRACARTPITAAVVAVTLALGIGASTATFSVVRAVLLEPLPYTQPDRLVALWPGFNFNASMVREVLAQAPGLESASGYSGWMFTLTGEGEPREIDGARVSPDHFRVLGVAPFLGRDFTAEEGVPGNDGVAVLSHGLWLRAFGGDPEVLGRRVELATNDLDGRTVIGVMPPDYRPLTGSPQVWVPLSLEAGIDVARDNSWYVNHRVARLAPGVTVEQASEQVRGFARSMREKMPGLVDEESVALAGVQPLGEYAAGSVGPVLWAALAAVSLVLLIACANVANLLLARGEARQRELAVRAALGAGRGRVVRLLLAETGFLGLSGGLLGVLLSLALVRVVVTLAPAGFPRVADIAVNGGVLVYALVASLAATLLAGLVPALRVSRVDPGAAMGGTVRASSSLRASRLTPVLVGAEVALAVIVIAGSGLMLRSLHRMMSEDPGLDAAGVVTFRPNPPSGQYPDGAAFEAFYTEVLERVATLPAVESVSAIQLVPGTLQNWSFPTFPEGVEVGDGPVPSANVRLVYPGYFETVGVPLLGGRTLEPTDDAASEPVVVVNRAFVDRFWPDRDPLRRSLRFGGSDSAPRRVVGVVANVRQHGLGRDPLPEMYFSHRQLPWNTPLSVVARMAPGSDPLAHAAVLRDAVWSVNPDVPISDFEELSSVYGRSAATTRFLAAVLGAFGGLALALGAVGVFGVTTYTVARRTPEFGVRMALGASRRTVLGVALARSLTPVAAGLGLGLLAAAASTGALASALYEIEPTDPVTFVLVGLTLLGVATLAALLPAWRACRLDPVTVLHTE